MCKITSKLRFCTCIEAEDVELININKGLSKFYEKQLHESKSPFIWMLYEYLGTDDVAALGFLFMPSSTVGFLTENFVLAQLNNENCFDFSYEPKEGDNLQITSHGNKNQGEYLSFIYSDRKWSVDCYSKHNEIIRPKNYGMLKVTE